MTTNTLTTTLTQLDAWGHKTSVRVTWMPEETAGYDAGMDNIGRRTFAFDSIDTPPVRLRVVMTGGGVKELYVYRADF